MYARRWIRIAVAIVVGLVSFAVPQLLGWEDLVCALVGTAACLGGWFMQAPAPGSRETW